MNIFLIISSIFFTTLAVGFFVGFFRGWCKSLIRLGITIANIAIAVFLSPFITGVITSNITEGSEISIFKFTLNLSDLFKDIIGNDITISQTTTNLLTTAIANVLANILLFLVIFLFLQVFSLMIYWIIILVLHLKCKEEKEPQNIGLRCLGGLQGLIGAIALLFVVLVPCFGIINILDKTSTNSTVPESIPQANAVSISNSFMCGELFYESEELNQIDSYINSYASLKKQYDSTLMGIILKYTGINKLGTLSFNHLTNVKVMGEKISLTNEVISVIETYNSAKTMLSDKLDYTSNNFIENVRSVYEDASQSIFIQKYLTDIIPVWAEKWSNDETFFNVSNPIPEQYHETANHMLKAIASIQSFSRLDRNINTILDSIVILNEHDFLTLLTDGQDVVSLLSNDKTIVKEILFTLSSTGELRNNLPNTLNSSLSILYDIVVGDDKFTPNISDTLFEELDWDLETDIIQNIVNEFLITYNSLSNPEVSNSEILTLLGKSIDSSRNSIILSKYLKSFIIY